MRLRIRDSSEPEGAQSWFPGLYITPRGENWELLHSKGCVLCISLQTSPTRVAWLWFREYLYGVRNLREPTLGVCLEGLHREEPPVLNFNKNPPLLYDFFSPTIWDLNHPVLLTSGVG